jgi:hypothetical protein
VKDFNRRKRNQEQHYEAPAVKRETKPTMMELGSLAAPPVVPPQVEASVEAKKGMTLAGVGESAIGTAGVMLLKDQLFDKEHRKQFQQQMNQLLQQQAWISRQILDLKNKMDQLCNAKETSSWHQKLMM